MSYEYPDHLCVNPDHQHVSNSEEHAWCATCSKKVPLGWSKPRKNARANSVPRAVTLGGRVQEPLRALHEAIAGRGTACSRLPGMFDAPVSYARNAYKDREIAERRREAAELCDACPFLDACNEYAEATWRTLEPGAILAGRWVARRGMSHPILSKERVA